MKSLSSASFFRTFDLLVGVSNPGLKKDRWKVEDVSCARDRHGFNGGTYCFAIEIFFLSRPGRHGWEFMVMKENWWKAGQTQLVKSFRWSHRTSGDSKGIMNWMRSQEKASQHQS